MSRAADAEIGIPEVLRYVYQLYKDDKIEEFLEAADLLLEQDFLLHRADKIQLLLFAANRVAEPRETLDYFQRARSIYEDWQFRHQESDIRTLEILGRKLEAIRKVVDREEAEWVKEQEDLEDQELMDAGPEDAGTDIEEDHGFWDNEDFSDADSMEEWDFVEEEVVGDE